MYSSIEGLAKKRRHFPSKEVVHLHVHIRSLLRSSNRDRRAWVERVRVVLVKLENTRDIYRRVSYGLAGVRADIGRIIRLVAC